MATSLVSTGVQFPDATIQTTAAGALPTFTASGSIPSAGVVVGINSDGTVSTITGAASVLGGSYNSNYPSISQIGYQATGAANSTGDTVLIFQQTTASGTPGMLFAGTVSGTQITFGTGVSLGNGIDSASIMFCPAQSRFVVSYRANTGAILTVSVSGTTITLGTLLTGYAANCLTGLASDCSGSTVFGMAREAGNNYPLLMAFTVSGATISVASTLSLTGAGNNINGARGRCAFSAVSNLICGTYQNSSTGFTFYTFATYSGGTWTLGVSNNVSISNNGSYATVTYSSTKDCFILIYSNNLRVLTYSGTTGTFGTAVTPGYSATDTYVPFAQYNNVGDRMCAAFMTGSTQVIFLIYILDATARTLTLEETFTPYSGAAGSDMGAVFCSVSTSKSQQTANVWVQFRDANTNGFRAVTLAYSTRSNLIGIAQNSAASGASVSVKTLGEIDSNQSSLTTGSDYYISLTGTVSTTVSTGAKLGKALSATRLLITQNA